MRLEPWPSSLSCQRCNQKSIFRLLIRSIIKVNKIIFVLAAPHIFCVILRPKSPKSVVNLLSTLFFTDFFVLKRDFCVTVQYPCKLFTLGLLNSYFTIFTNKVQ
jgi:hypothetical protein